MRTELGSEVIFHQRVYLFDLYEGMLFEHPEPLSLVEYLESHESSKERDGSVTARRYPAIGILIERVQY